MMVTHYVEMKSDGAESIITQSRLEDGRLLINFDQPNLGGLRLRQSVIISEATRDFLIVAANNFRVREPEFVLKHPREMQL